MKDRERERVLTDSTFKIQHSKFNINPSLSVALYEPEIPGNAGNVARLCAATGAPLHLIGRLGFSFSHPAARRAAMDYWEQVEVHRHVSYGDFREAIAPRPVWMLSTRGRADLWEAEFEPDAVLLFGPESRGLPEDLLASDPARTVRIPMRPDLRSLNLATAVGVAVYEALRRTGWRAPDPDRTRPAAGESPC